MTEISLREWSERVAANSKAKGFQLATWDNFPTKLMLIMTEVQEAIDAADGTGDLAEELADISIRSLEALDSIWRDQWSDGRIVMRPRGTPRLTWKEPQVVFGPIVWLLTRACEAWREDAFRDAMISIELVLLNVFRIADAAGIDLMDAIRAKHAKNSARPHLHGKARSDG